MATVQMIVVSAKRQKQMCLVEEMGRKGPAELQDSCFPMPPSASSWLSPQYLSWTLWLLLSQHTTSKPRAVSNCPPEGAIPCFLQSRILSWILPREALELSP